MLNEMIACPAEHKFCRLFIAIAFPEKIQQEVHILQQFIRTQNYMHMMMSCFDHLHATLLFLGEVAKQDVTPIHDILEKEKRKEIFAEWSGRVDLFYRNKNPSAIVVPIFSGDLERFLIKLRDSLSFLRTIDMRPFHLHATLARIKRCFELEKLQLFLKTIPQHQYVFPVRVIYLKESVHINGQLKHIIRATYEL